MPSLVCSAQNCVYNDSMYCSKGDIMVGGDEAHKSQETCCESFQERRADSMRNSVGTPSADIMVDCQACNCTYNENLKCTAGKIDISGVGASSCDETECSTLYCECQ